MLWNCAFNVYTFTIFSFAILMTQIVHSLILTVQGTLYFYDANPLLDNTTTHTLTHKLHQYIQM